MALGYVSIHAPAWGATMIAQIGIMCFGLFQSTRPHGARQRVGHSTVYCILFQSTRPHGARLFLWCILVGACNVSIHAPAWGATPFLLVLLFSYACFNPRARMGRDRAGFTYPTESSSFNPRARMGRDNRKCAHAVHTGCFNPRARMGRDSKLLD